MKKILPIIFITFVLISTYILINMKNELNAYVYNPNMSHTNNIVADDDFLINFDTQKYHGEELIVLFYDINYIGKDDSITITHSSPLITLEILTQEDELVFSEELLEEEVTTTFYAQKKYKYQVLTKRKDKMIEDRDDAVKPDIKLENGKYKLILSMSYESEKGPQVLKNPLEIVVDDQYNERVKLISMPVRKTRIFTDNLMFALAFLFKND